MPGMLFQVSLLFRLFFRLALPIQDSTLELALLMRSLSSFSYVQDRSRLGFLLFDHRHGYRW